MERKESKGTEGMTPPKKKNLLTAILHQPSLPCYLFIYFFLLLQMAARHTVIQTVIYKVTQKIKDNVRNTKII